VTSDDDVVYVAQDADASGQTVFAIAAGGGQPVVLSTAVNEGAIAVAGATAVWLELTSSPCVADGLAMAIKSWSRARGTQVIASSALLYSAQSFGVTGQFASTGGALGPFAIALNADNSRVAYTEACSDAGTTLVLAATDGISPPLTASLPLNAGGATMTVSVTTVGVVRYGSGIPLEMLAGSPLAVTLPSPANVTTDPTGAWAWEPDSDGGTALVRTSDGSAVFNDPKAAPPINHSGIYDISGPEVFDATGANMFYLSSAGVNELALASPTAARTLAGTSGLCASLLQAAPDGTSVLCEANGNTLGYYVITTGATPAIVSIPDPSAPMLPVSAYGPTGAAPFFLGDSTLVWSSGDSLFAEHAFLGTVATLATSSAVHFAIGGSQIGADGPTGLEIMDVTGSAPPFVPSPPPESISTLTGVLPGCVPGGAEVSLCWPAQGGLVAYAAGGSIYSVQTW
jgi:hypothetical protein